MNCSTPGFPVLHYLLEFAQIHGHWVNDATQLSHPVVPSSHPDLNPSQHQGLFPMSWLFKTGGWGIGASASVLPMNTQGWFSLGLTGLLSLQSRGLWRVQNLKASIQFRRSEKLRTNVIFNGEIVNASFLLPLFCGFSTVLWILASVIRQEIERILRLKGRNKTFYSQ